MKPDTVVVGYLDGGTWSACFGLSYRDVLLHDLATGAGLIMREGGKELRQLCGTNGIVAGRNRVAADFVDKTDGEWLWFIDTDMGFADDTVAQLVRYADRNTSPVVGALCFKQTRRPSGPLHAERWEIQPTLYEYVELEDEVGFRPMLDYPRDTLVRVAATGAACLLIHRSVLEKVRAEHGDNWFTEITHPTGLRGRPRTFGEDMSFCVRCQALGVPIKVHTGVKTTHEKGGVFLDEETFDLQRVPVPA